MGFIPLLRPSISVTEIASTLRQAVSGVAALLQSVREPALPLASLITTHRGESWYVLARRRAYGALLMLLSAPDGLHPRLQSALLAIVVAHWQHLTDTQVEELLTGDADAKQPPGVFLRTRCPLEEKYGSVLTAAIKELAAALGRGCTLEQAYDSVLTSAQRDAVWRGGPYAGVDPASNLLLNHLAVVQGMMIERDLNSRKNAYTDYQQLPERFVQQQASLEDRLSRVEPQAFDREQFVQYRQLNQWLHRHEWSVQLPVGVAQQISHWLLRHCLPSTAVARQLRNYCQGQVSARALGEHWQAIWSQLQQASTFSQFLEGVNKALEQGVLTPVTVLYGLSNLYNTAVPLIPVSLMVAAMVGWAQDTFAGQLREFFGSPSSEIPRILQELGRLNGNCASLMQCAQSASSSLPEWLNPASVPLGTTQAVDNPGARAQRNADQHLLEQGGAQRWGHDLPPGVTEPPATSNGARPTGIMQAAQYVAQRVVSAAVSLYCKAPEVHEEADVGTPLCPASDAVYQPTAPIAAAGQHWPALGTGLGIVAASTVGGAGTYTLYQAMTANPDPRPASEPLFALYRGARSEAPPMEDEPDFDLPIYTPYVNEVLAQALGVVEASPAAPLAGRFDRDTSARPEFFKRADRVKRLAVLQVGQKGFQAHSDPGIQLARRALDFSKYDDLVAGRFNRLWRQSITPSSDKSLSIEQQKNLYLKQFHQSLIQAVDLILATLDDLKQEGTGSHSRYRKAIVWLASLAAEAGEVQQRPSNPNAGYWKDWRDDPRGETLSALNRAFRIPQREDDTYFQQRQAWMQPSIITDDDYLQAPDLDNIQKMWRSALVLEQREFEKLIDDYVHLKSFETLPDLFENALKLRVEILGAELYELLNEEDLSAPAVKKRAVDTEILEMRKIHLANAYLDEIESYAICKYLKKRGLLLNKYLEDQAVFEAKKIAAELVVEKFAVEVSSLDDEQDILAFYQIAGEGGVSDHAEAYLNKASALAFFMMTRVSQGGEYRRWTTALSASFAQASARNEHFKRFYEERPAGYKGLDTFKKSSESETWVEYYNQFIQYREKYIDFDSRQMAYGALVSQGLSDYGISQLQVEKIVYADLVVYFDANAQVDELLKSGDARDPGNKFHNMLNTPTEVPGTIGFITLANGGILAMSGLAFKVTVKLFDPSAVGASPVLSKIHSLAAIPYLGTVGKLEGRNLIAEVLRPMGVDTDALIGNSGYPILKAPRKFRSWWERYQMERLHPKQGCSLMSVADEVMKENLIQWVGLLKVANKDPDFWGIVLSFLPLYTELRDTYTDPDHRLDGNRIMWDVFGIILSIVPALGAINQLSRTAFKLLIHESMQGLVAGHSFKVVTRQVLQALMTNPAFTGLGLKGFGSAAYIGFDVVSPVPAELCVFGLMRIRKFTMAYLHRAGVAADSLLSTLNNTPSFASSILPRKVLAELTALGATTRVSVEPSKIIVLRNSPLTSRELIEEGLALAAPLDRKQRVMKRIEKRARDSIGPVRCAPMAPRQPRSLEHDCLDDLDDLDYRGKKNVIDAGHGYKVYTLRNSEDSYVVREFRSLQAGDQPQRIRKAENNREAYDRLYANKETGKAEVFYFKGEGPVVTLLPSTPGKTLSAIIAGDDRTAIEGLRLLDKTLVVEQLVKLLGDNGVLYSAMDFSGIVFDSTTWEVRLNNFDKAVINPRFDDDKPAVLKIAQVKGLTTLFTQVFDDFIERTQALRPNDVGINTSLLTPQQLAQLDQQRGRYTSHFQVLASGKTAEDFNFAKKYHRGIEVHGVSKTASELVLTTRYNELSATADVRQLGALSGVIENVRRHRTIQGAISVAAKYSRQLKSGSYQQIIAPQSFWLIASDAPRVGEGRCYPLVLAVSVAIMEYSSTNFFMNMMRSAARTDSSHNEFIRAIDQIRTLDMKEFITPQLNASPMSLEKILTYLVSLRSNSVFVMDSRSHSMLIGVTFDIFGDDSYYFYDPNIGIFTYPTIDLLTAALHGSIGTTSLAGQYAAWNLPGLPKYKLALISTQILKGKTLQVPPAQGPGFKTRTVGELSSSLDPIVDCLPLSPARRKRTPACSPIERDIILMLQTQEALFIGKAAPDGSYQQALDFAVRLRDEYSARFTQGLDMEREFAFLDLTRQQLIATDAAASAPTGADNSSASPDPGVYYNYLTALITVAKRIVRFDNGHRD